jgi:hypothetical protein
MWAGLAAESGAGLRGLSRFQVQPAEQWRTLQEHMHTGLLQHAANNLLPPGLYAWTVWLWCVDKLDALSKLHRELQSQAKR